MTRITRQSLPLGATQDKREAAEGMPATWAAGDPLLPSPPSISTLHVQTADSLLWGHRPGKAQLFNTTVNRSLRK